MKITLAEALLRRKELQEKVDQLRTINKGGLFEIKVTRRPAHEGVDDIVAQVPKITLGQATAAFDWHARRLRMVDALIQKTNWDTILDIDDTVMADYVDPKAD